MTPSNSSSALGDKGVKDQITSTSDITAADPVSQAEKASSSTSNDVPHNPTTSTASKVSSSKSAVDPKKVHRKVRARLAGVGTMQ